MTDRDELADLIREQITHDTSNRWTMNLVDAILARWRLVPVEEQHRAADELTQHDQAAGHYDDGCKPCTDLRTAMLDLHQRGFSDRQIAERLGMSTRTIANRRRKMGLQYNDGKAIRTDQHGPHED